MTPTHNPPPAHGEVTRILAVIRRGEPDAVDRLYPHVYQELRGVAERQLRRERSDHTLHPTALGHETYMKMAGSGADPGSRSHFLAIAAHELLGAHALGGGLVERLLPTPPEPDPPAGCPRIGTYRVTGEIGPGGWAWCTRPSAIMATSVPTHLGDLPAPDCGHFVRGEWRFGPGTDTFPDL